MLPKVVKHNGAHELFMNTYGCRRSTVLLAIERSVRDTIRGVQIRAGAVRIYIFIFITYVRKMDQSDRSIGIDIPPY